MIDDAARVLRLNERELHVQPLVFDLLVYLVRERARVISKDELLEALWPGVIVTENSLQRAISTLRTVLREGDMQDAIRSVPRAGYRFCLELVPPPDAAEGGDDLTQARHAAEARLWNEAAVLYSKTDAATLSGTDLDQWALALQCAGNPSDAVPVFTRAIAAHTQKGDLNAAAESAISLAGVHLERNELAVAKGWTARAAELTAQNEASRARGLVTWMQARIAGSEGNPRLAHEKAEAAYAIGRGNGDVGVEALGLMYRGFYRLSLGDTAAGLEDQDHASALALSHTLDPVTGGTLFCNILWACRTFCDWSRATQWTLGYRQFCTDSRMQFSGSCELHRAEVLGVQGSLKQALGHIEEALARLQNDAPWARGDAYRVLGDIQSAIGNTDAARAAYEKCYALGWDPEPGYALLLLAEGEAEQAYAALERSLIGQGWWTLQRQGMLLAHLALVAAHARKPEKAQALIDDLAGQEKRWPMPSIRALTNEAAAILAKQSGDPDEARRRLHLARQLWTGVECRLNATRLRLEIAAVALDAGDVSGASSELRVASADAQALGSAKLQERCAALEKRLPKSA
ncbi:hypothetical protein IZ6_03890 [Terrihabitans soli]|uniref:OmpR/PhoB-type domain-containing protein n=1 Tax=Terrihabitans soli TaxID=708113 RepID=A0A6S6QHM2_9HYPH|nr:hypothetical protein IZ6_03890 [Terrihabitans soli]